MVAISGSDTLLDVGTGTGAVLRELKRLAVRPARAIGVDVSKPMLARARATLSPGTELLAADARALPLADASVNVATCAYLLHLLPTTARAAVLRSSTGCWRPVAASGWSPSPHRSADLQSS